LRRKGNSARSPIFGRAMLQYDICFQELPISSRNEWSDGFGSYRGTLHVWFWIHVALDLNLKGKFEMNISLLTLYSLQISHELESFRVSDELPLVKNKFQGIVVHILLRSMIMVSVVVSPKSPIHSIQIRSSGVVVRATHQIGRRHQDTVSACLICRIFFLRNRKFAEVGNSQDYNVMLNSIGFLEYVGIFSSSVCFTGKSKEL
jgi:hypothetical protein